MKHFPQAGGIKASGYYKLWYEDLVPVTVAAINEISARQETQQEKIERLEKRVAELEKA